MFGDRGGQPIGFYRTIHRTRDHSLKINYNFILFIFSPCFLYRFYDLFVEPWLLFQFTNLILSR
jgi:hypothetical protein